MDLIDRQAAIDALDKIFPADPMRNDYTQGITCGAALATEYIKQLPSAQPEIIRCKDCRWWDKYGDYDNGYCIAAKHGYWSEHWEISIRRTYKGDFYCADAEPKGEQE